MVGSQRRTEYTMFGDAINLGARLMVKASQQSSASASANGGGSGQQDAGVGGLVYCDAATQQLARGKAQYSLLEPMRLKGKEQLVEVFEVDQLSSSGISPLGPRLLALPLPAGQEVGGGVAAAAAEPAVGRSGSQLSLPQRHHSLGDLLRWNDRLTSVMPSGSNELGLAVPMIGRGPELAALAARVVALVERRAGGVVLVEGEPGMGKTRLVEELQAR